MMNTPAIPQLKARIHEMVDAADDAALLDEVYTLLSETQQQIDTAQQQEVLRRETIPDRSTIESRAMLDGLRSKYGIPKTTI